MTKKMLIFDMDGTIVDSMPTLAALGAAFIENMVFGMTPTDAALHYKKTVGRPFREQLDAIPQFYDRDAKDRTAALYAQVHAMVAPLFPLTALGQSLSESKKCMTALVSSTDQRIVQSMTQLLTCGFDAIRGYDGPFIEKHVQIRSVLIHHHVEKEDCIYVGDTEYDFAIARQLGIAFAREQVPLDELYRCLFNPELMAVVP